MIGKLLVAIPAVIAFLLLLFPLLCAFWDIWHILTYFYEFNLIPSIVYSSKIWFYWALHLLTFILIGAFILLYKKKAAKLLCSAVFISAALTFLVDVLFWFIQSLLRWGFRFHTDNILYLLEYIPGAFLLFIAAGLVFLQPKKFRFPIVVIPLILFPIGGLLAKLYDLIMYFLYDFESLFDLFALLPNFRAIIEGNYYTSVTTPLQLLSDVFFMISLLCIGFAPMFLPFTPAEPQKKKAVISAEDKGALNLLDTQLEQGLISEEAHRAQRDAIIEKYLS